MMFEYNNKNIMLHITEKLETAGKTRVALTDVETQLPSTLKNRKFVASCILREMIEYRIVAANMFEGAHPFLSKGQRAYGIMENLRCVDIFLLFLMEDNVSSFEDVKDYFDLYASSMSRCFYQKCVPCQQTSSSEILDMYRLAYMALERLIYCNLIKEVHPGTFSVNTQEFERIGEDSFNLLREKIFSCSKFKNFFIKEYGNIFDDEDFDYE